MNAFPLRIAVQAVELRCDGLQDWQTAGPVLAGTEPYCATPLALVPPSQLSAAERRRAIPSVSLALAVGAAALVMSGHDPSALPCVFASSGADGDTIHAVLSALAEPAREVSPTRFHNSVHNAPSGYWGVAMQSREPVTSLSCYDASFAMGLLEAAVQALSGQRPVLLIAYDLPYPNPLDGVRPIRTRFGTAFVLSPGPSERAIAELRIDVTPPGNDAATVCADPGLEAVRRGNPAARSLPLLAALAARAQAAIRLDLRHGMLDIGVTPC